MGAIWITLSFKIMLCPMWVYTCFKEKPLLKLTSIFHLSLGIRKLITNGSYIAAFPPHEVILKNIFHLVKYKNFILWNYVAYFPLL
jgi:hypothetical protein